MSQSQFCNACQREICRKENPEKAFPLDAISHTCGIDPTYNPTVGMKFTKLKTEQAVKVYDLRFE